MIMCHLLFDTCAHPHLLIRTITYNYYHYVWNSMQRWSNVKSKSNQTFLIWSYVMCGDVYPSAKIVWMQPDYSSISMDHIISHQHHHHNPPSKKRVIEQTNDFLDFFNGVFSFPLFLLFWTILEIPLQHL